MIKNKLKDFVRASMENLKTTHKTLNVDDKLVWGAIIHDNRLYTKEDLQKAKQGGGEAKFKVGDVKAGANTHIHVVLSARDAEQKKTITILTNQNRVSKNFELMNFQQNNQKLFQKMFFYKNGINIYAAGQIKIASDKLDKLNSKIYNKYDIKEITKAGNKMEWSTQFNRNLNYMIQEAYQGNKILYPDIYLEKGKQFYNENVPNGKEPITKLYQPFEKELNKSNKDMLDVIGSALEMQGNKDERKGYDLVKKIKRKRRPGQQLGM